MKKVFMTIGVGLLLAAGAFAGEDATRSISVDEVCRVALPLRQAGVGRHPLPPPSRQAGIRRHPDKSGQGGESALPPLPRRSIGGGGLGRGLDVPFVNDQHQDVSLDPGQLGSESPSRQAGIESYQSFGLTMRGDAALSFNIEAAKAASKKAAPVPAGERLGAAATFNCRAHAWAPTVAYESGPWKNFLGTRITLDTLAVAGVTQANSFAGGAVGKFFELGSNPWTGRTRVFLGVGVLGDLQSALAEMRFDVRLMAGLHWSVGAETTGAKETVVMIGERSKGKDSKE